MSPMQKLIMILSFLMSFSSEFMEKFIMILTEGDLDFSNTISEFAENFMIKYPVLTRKLIRKY